MANVVVKFDAAAVTRMLANLGDNLPKVVSRALNKTIASAQTDMKREIAQDIGIKVGVVAKNLKISKASTSNLVAKLRAFGKRIPLIQLGAKGPIPSRGKGHGVTYRLGGKTRRIPSAFIATVGKGEHKGVFKRATTKRLPIRELFGPSIAQVFSKKLPSVQKKAEEQFVTEVDRAIKSLLL